MTMKIPAIMLSLLLPLPVPAQQPHGQEVPRTRTFSGLVAPAFPYARPAEVGLSSEKLDRLGDEIVSWIANGELVGAELLVIKDGKAVCHEAYGWGDREARRPLRRNSIFTIQSMSKPFTATAALMLVEEGKLSLDDPVSRYVQGFTHDSITVRHLLSHTSGFIHDGDWYDYTSADASLEELVEEWPHRDPERPVGSFNYADFNYATLAYIVTKASGIPIAHFIEQRIIRPLGLEDTRVGFSSDPAWRARLNHQYRWNERAGAYDLRRTSDYRGWTMYPGGWGLLSTAMDYAQFLGMWLQGGEWRGARLLAEETVQQALRPHPYQDPSEAYGYGWFVDDIAGEGRLPFLHGGGHGTLAMAFPADDAMVLYMTQSRWGRHRAAFANRLLMAGVFEHPGYSFDVTPMQWANPRDVAAIELSGAKRGNYIGTYAAGGEMDDMSEVLRVLENEAVLILRKGPPSAKADLWFHLVPTGDHRFRMGRYQDGRLVAIDDRHEIRFEVADGVATVLELIKDDGVVISARRTQ
jgi:CubicO group peptidase (beta-lactamase class C family)